MPAGRERVRVQGRGNVRGGVVAVYPDPAEVIAETRFEVRPDGIRQRFAAAKARLAVKVPLPSISARLPSISGPSLPKSRAMYGDGAAGSGQRGQRHCPPRTRTHPSRYRIGVQLKIAVHDMPRPFRGGAARSWPRCGAAPAHPVETSFPPSRSVVKTTGGQGAVPQPIPPGQAAR